MRLLITTLILLSFNAHAQYGHLESFNKVVSSSLTAEALTGSATLANFVIIKAKATNSASVSIGSQGAQNYSLAAGDSVTLQVTVGNGNNRPMELQNIYINATEDGDGVEAAYGLSRSAR